MTKETPKKVFSKQLIVKMMDAFSFRVLEVRMHKVHVIHLSTALLVRIENRLSA